MINSIPEKVKSFPSSSVNFSRAFLLRTAVLSTPMINKSLQELSSPKNSSIATSMHCKAHSVVHSTKISILLSGILNSWGKSFPKPSSSISLKKSSKCKYKLPCDNKSTFQVEMTMNHLMATHKKTMSTVSLKSMRLCFKPESTVKTHKAHSLKRKKKMC